MRLERIFLSLLLAGSVATLPACSSHSHSKTTKTVTYEDPDARARYSAPLVEERVEVREKEVHDDADYGLFGILGDIISLPFKALSAIF